MPNNTPEFQDEHPELPLDPDVLQPITLHLTPTFQTIVFIGGCLGAYTRYGVSTWLPTKNTWPMATFLVNLAGAFMLGMLLEGLARRGHDIGTRRLLRLGIGTGFLGAFTTYSTFAVDADLLIKAHQGWLAFWYIAATIGLGLILSALGIRLAAEHHQRTNGGRQ